MDHKQQLKIPEIVIKNKHAYTFGLTCACPHENPSKSCPLEKVRKLDGQERFEYVQNRSEEQIEDFLAHHFACSAKLEVLSGCAR